jgi:hypothetical protein
MLFARKEGPSRTRLYPASLAFRIRNVQRGFYVINLRYRPPKNLFASFTGAMLVSSVSHCVTKVDLFHQIAFRG